MCAETEERLTGMLNEFSEEYLDEEYEYLTIKLAERLVESGVSLKRGRLENWACAIILAVGQLNFLFDYQTRPYITQNFLCSYFGSNRQTVTVKARNIRRELKLKLGDEEFSTRTVLMMNIPESDEDLDRIRQLDEVKFLLSQKPPSDVWDVENTELVDLIHDDKIDDEIYSLLRNAYFIGYFSGPVLVKIDDGGGKFLIPLFTSIDECGLIIDAFKDFKPNIWPLVNALSFMGSEKFNGVILNLDIDDFIVSKDMIARIYADYENIDYWNIFYAR